MRARRAGEVGGFRCGAFLAEIPEPFCRGSGSKLHGAPGGIRFEVEKVGSVKKNVFVEIARPALLPVTIEGHRELSPDRDVRAADSGGR